MLMGTDITITVDPQARIQGLLETVDRYLSWAREIEAKRLFLTKLCVGMRNTFIEVNKAVDEMTASAETMMLSQMLDEIIDATDYMVEWPAETL